MSVAPCSEQFKKESSLFTDNGRYVIVGSAAFVPEEPHVPMHNMYRNNGIVSPNPRNPLGDYTLYIVEIQEDILWEG